MHLLALYAVAKQPSLITESGVRPLPLFRLGDGGLGEQVHGQIAPPLLV